VGARGGGLFTLPVDPRLCQRRLEGYPTSVVAIGTGGLVSAGARCITQSQSSAVVLKLWRHGHRHGVNLPQRQRTSASNTEFGSVLFSAVSRRSPA